MCANCDLGSALYDSAADSAWSLLQHYLRVHEDSTAQLHRTVTVRLLSQGFPLPSWMIKSYKVQKIK